MTPKFGLTDDDEVLHWAATRLSRNLGKEWDTDCIDKVLNILDILELSVAAIAKYNLGRIIGKIQKKASGNSGQLIEKKAKKIISKWKMQLRKEKEAMKETLTQAGVTKPSSPLVIQDKPTVNSISSTTTVPNGKYALTDRPTSFDSLLDEIQKRHFASNHCINKKVDLKLMSFPKATKHVQFKPDHQLSTIIGHHAKTPTRNSNSAMSVDSYNETSLGGEHTWYRPRLIQIPNSCRRPNATRSHGTTSNQYKTVNHHTPSSPLEHEEEHVTNNYTKIIPLFEMDTSDDDEPCVQTPGIVNTLPFWDGYLPSSDNLVTPSNQVHIHTYQ